MLLSINQLWELTGRDRKTVTKKLENLTFTAGDKGAHLYESAQALPLIYSVDNLEAARAKQALSQASVATGAQGGGTTLDLTVHNFVSLQRRIRGDRNDQRGNDCRQQTNDLERLARDIGFHPVNRLTLQNWRAKIDLFPVGGDGLYLIKEKHNPDGPRRLNAPPRLIFAQFFGLKPCAYFQIKTDFSLVSS